ncbi:hypothetical protein KWH36_20510, partial [Xanthomonas campestris pv. fici]|nr:hypothetical protein [Xanthomonas campestris pv. fici]
MSLSPDALKVLNDFGNEPGVTKPHVDQLRQLLTDSPELTRQLKGSTPFSRTLTRRPIKAMRSVHVKAQ